MELLKEKLNAVGKQLTKDQMKNVIGGVGKDNCQAQDCSGYKCVQNGYCSSCCVCVSC
jgi:bacteriocin-like protein